MLPCVVTVVGRDVFQAAANKENCRYSLEIDENHSNSARGGSELESYDEAGDARGASQVHLRGKQLRST